MDQDQEDPFDWSVDQVVQYLCCNDSTPWSASKNPSPLPDPTQLEVALREHGITGEVFLNGRLNDFLRNTLKLKEGPYYTVNKAIQHAQRLSTKFKAMQAQDNSQFASTMLPVVDSSRAWPFPFNAPWMFQTMPAHSHISQPTALQQNTPTIENEVEKVPNSHFLVNLPASQLSSSSRVAEIDDVDLPDATALTGLEKGSTDLPYRGPSPSLRPHEAAHIDEHGRKRRRLDLTSVEPKRSTIPKTSKSPATVLTRAPESWYMGPDKIDVTDIFYPIQLTSDGDNWSFSSSKHSVGRRLFVKRKITSFFRKRPIRLPSVDGIRRSALFPYDEDEANRGKPRYYTLYTTHKDKTEVSMKSTADPDHEVELPADTSLRTESASPYDYLIEKYPVREDEDSYPAFGESGSEGEYDSDTWREIEDEREETALRASKCLSAHEVDLTIDQCIKNYEDKWKIKHLPKLQLEAHNLWLDALRNRCRNSRIKVLWDSIERLNSRLGKIRKELHGHEWMQRVHLEHQCECMEQTVFEIESQKQRVSILELLQCPPKPPSIPRVPAKPKAKAKQSSLDEESVESDSGDDSLGNFVVDDMSMYVVDGPITDAVPDEKQSRDTIGVPNTTTTTITDSNTVGRSHSHRSRQFSVQKEALQKELVNEGYPDSESVTAQRQLGFYYSSESDSDHCYSPPPPMAIQNFPSSDVEVIDLTLSPKPDRCAQPCKVLSNFESRKGTDEFTVVIPSSQKEKLSYIPDITPISSPKYPNFDKTKERHKVSRFDVLEKMVDGIPDEARSAMIECLLPYSKKKFRHFVRAALRALEKDKLRLGGLDAKESDLVLRATVMYVSWVDLRQFNTSGIPKASINKAVDNIEGLKTDSGFDFSEYTSQLFELLSRYNSKAATPSTGNSDDNLPELLTSTSHKKRKKRVKEDQAVKSGQAAAKQRVELQETQRKRLEERLERVGVSNNDPEHQAVSFEQPTIFLHPHIGGRVKPHQLSGIQFMWREIIANEKRDGCLLAHTMGLGKTMQVISLLVTIAAAANSQDPAVRGQVPTFFHRSQALILCPPSLIDNWYEEFLMWTPKEHNLGPIRKIAPSDNPGTKVTTVEAWDNDGGILILSYHLFRNWVEPQGKRKNGVEIQAPSKLRDVLLKGPRIIVADEAHQMKNKNSVLAQAAALIESKSRIALSGSPLANNLIDYYAMVNWISPKYLDELPVFRQKYLEPIEAGLFSDSTYQEQRRSLKKLQILKEILNPKINRADISVLEGSLPMKVEFVITVPLTEVQKKAYNLYAASLSEAKRGNSSVQTTTFLSWLAVLGLCCNHPSCFYEKLAKRAEERAPKTVNEDLADSDLFPVEVPLSSLGFDEALWAPQKELLSAIPDLDDVKYSYRAGIFNKIVDESIRVGDKILCFSHSIPTLNYLEKLLLASGVNFQRLDGSTAVRTRQAAIKSFNVRDDVKVYLISTRAGGLGLNITGANRVVIFDFGFNPTWEEQAVGRAYRLGQKKPVYIYRFLSAGTFEEAIHNKSIFKTQLAMRVVDKKNVQRSALKSFGEYLNPVKDVNREELTEFIGKDRDVLDKILSTNCASSPSILKIALTETFRRENDEMLTEDEKKEMEQELELELLRMSNPAAYEKKMLELTLANYPPSTNPSFTNFTSTSSAPHIIYNNDRPMAMPTTLTRSDQTFFNPPSWPGAVSPPVRTISQTNSPFVTSRTSDASGVATPVPGHRALRAPGSGPGPATGAGPTPNPTPAPPAPPVFSQLVYKIGDGPTPMHPSVISKPPNEGAKNAQDTESVADLLNKSIPFSSQASSLSPRPPTADADETNGLPRYVSA